MGKKRRKWGRMRDGRMHCCTQCRGMHTIERRQFPGTYLGSSRLTRRRRRGKIPEGLQRTRRGRRRLWKEGGGDENEGGGGGEEERGAGKSEAEGS